MAKHALLRSGKSELMKRRNELWYRQRLKVVSGDVKESVTPPLTRYIATLPSSDDALEAGDKATVHRAVKGILGAGRASFEMPINPKRTSQTAALLNQRTTDQWWVQYMRQYLPQPLQAAHLPQPRVMDAAPPQPKGAPGATQAQRARLRGGLRVGPVQPLSTLSIIRGTEVQAAFENAVKDNIGLIRSIPPQYYDNLEAQLFDAVESAQHWEALADQLREGIGAANNLVDYRVDLIARDQTSKMASAFNEARCASVDITQYTWQTAGDERVRPSHAENDGKLLTFGEGAPIDDDGTMGDPGDAVNCRCVALPYVEEAEEEAA